MLKFFGPVFRPYFNVRGNSMMMEVYLGIVFVTSLIGAFGIGVTGTLLYVIYKENKIGH